MPGGERPSLRASTRQASNLTPARRFRRLVESLPERDEAGPGGPPRGDSDCDQSTYQLGGLGQAPLPAWLHVRVMFPALSRVIVNVVPDFDVATIV